MASTEDDYYELLEVDPTAPKEDILRAYRRKALLYHPDKNAHNPRAATVFIKIKQAKEILCDDEARAAYDGVNQARALRRTRDIAMSKERKRMCQDLASREEAAKRQKQEEQMARSRLQAEIARLQREGYMKLRQQEIEELRRPDDSSPKPKDEGGTLRVQWNKHDNPYSVEELREMFSPFGQLDGVVVRKNTALVSFKLRSSAHYASQQAQLGRNDCPLLIRWARGQGEKNRGPGKDSVPKKPALSSPAAAQIGAKIDLEDNERAVFARLKEAAQKQQRMNVHLTEQLFADQQHAEHKLPSSKQELPTPSEAAHNSSNST